MSQPKTVIRLRHMLEHSTEAVALVKGKSRADLDGDRVLNLALVRLLEIVGEAASQIEREQQALLDTIPWPQIVGLRNRLIHGYDAVDMDIVWQIVTSDLPPLARELERVLSVENADDQRER